MSADAGRSVVAGLCIALFCLLAPVSASRADDIATAIRNRIAGTEAARPNPGLRDERTAGALRRFYESRQFEPAWATGGGAAKRVRAAIDVLNRAWAHGLDPESYLPRSAIGSAMPRTAAGLADLDIRLSAGLASYGSDLRNGRAAAAPMIRRPGRDRPAIAPETVLSEAAAAPDLARFFAGLAPHTPAYARLKGALVTYRAIAAGGGWPRLPAGPTLRPGMTDPVIEILRRRLITTGDLTPTAAHGMLFDARLEAAVRHFQRRQGLTADGIVGAKTREALTIPVGQRIEQIRLNLERRRWMPENLGTNYIFVNMADFVLKVVEGRKTVLVMKVIVGTPYWRTPLFSADMTYMEFNPYWNIPQSIVRREIAAHARRDPHYIADQGIRVFRGWNTPAQELDPDRIDWRAVQRGTIRVRLRQEPGPLNPLGRVKFMFPNGFDVYLHDTPARGLFEREVRTFSHGCIRVEKPFALAAYLLRDDSPARIDSLLEGGRPRIVKLSRPIPVHLAYLTAWVNKDGTVNFRRDVYGRDRRLAQALRQSVARSD